MASENLDEKAIFNIARQIDSPDARREYLRQICGADNSLFGRVETLLQAYEEQASFLESPPVDRISPTLDQPITEKHGTQIGPYKLLQQLGEGGMGVVYMAEQKEPVKRRVALKIIKPGMDTRQVIARFEAERQALAMMDHPNIAKVLDAGATDSGRPYFVMELVNGLLVTKYCDEQHLTPKERLELFVPICQAVQHAHQKGIIHRDLKPSNILVTLYDGKAVPKIIDFGVAKATSQALTEKTMFTQYGQVVGTLEYMSPEQAGRKQLDIDTRSDIYSLGVVLYELLTGNTPFDRTRLRSAAFDEMLRIIREEEPPRPSAKLSSSHSLPSIAANRHIESQRLTGFVRGELDWIVMKALEKDRARRYETAIKFADDIERFLQDDPVEACPPSATYRLRKFVRRHRTPVLAVTSLLIVLVAGIIGTGVGLWRAIEARRAAEQATHLASQEAQRARHALAVADQRFELAKEAVDEYFNRVAGSSKLKQSDFVDLRHELLEAAIPFYERLVTENPSDLDQEAQQASAYGRLGSVRALMGDRVQARKAHQQMLHIYQRLTETDPQRVDYVQGLAVARNNLAMRCRTLGDSQQARKLFQEAAETWQTLVDKDGMEADQRRHFRQQLARSQSNLGDLLREIGKRDTARRILEKSLATRRTLVQEAPGIAAYRADLVSSLANLAVFLKDFDSPAALRALDEGIRVQQQLCDESPEDPERRAALCGCLNNRAHLLRLAGHHEDARAAYERVLQYRQQLARKFPEVPGYRAALATSHHSLGQLLRETGERSDARAAFEQARTIQQQLAGEFPHVPEYRFDMALSSVNLGMVLHELGDDQEAQDVLQEAVDTLRQLSQSDPEVQVYRFELANSSLRCADLLADAGELPAARRLVEQARDHYQNLASTAPSVTSYQHGIAGSWQALGDVVREMGEKEAALAAHEKALELFEKMLSASPEEPGLKFALAGVLASTFDLYDDQEQREHCAARAVALLRELAEQGFERQALLERIRVSRVFSQLRSRDDLLQLMKELEKPLTTESAPDST